MALKPVFQHRAVDLVQEPLVNLDNIVGPDSEDVPVVGGVVDLAEGEPILDDGRAQWIVVGTMCAASRSSRCASVHTAHLVSYASMTWLANTG